MCFFSYKVCFLSLAERWMRNSKHQICEITSLIAVSGLICGWIRCMCFATWQISMLRQFLGIVSRALWRASYSWLETHLFKQNDWSTRLWSSVALHSQWLTKIRLPINVGCGKHLFQAYRSLTTSITRGWMAMSRRSSFIISWWRPVQRSATL